MYLSQKLFLIYPELTTHPEYFIKGTITLQNDSNGEGTYIREWNYGQPQPTQEQLDALDTNE